jgi:hypothetical protein
MPATLNSEIQVNVFGAPQGVSTQGFGRALEVTEDVGVQFTQLYRLYTEIGDVNTDVLSGDLGPTVGARLAAFFSQKNRPPDVAVAKKEADAAQVITWTIQAGPAEDDEYDFIVNGIPIQHVAPSTPTPDTVATAVRAALTAALAAEAVTVSGATDQVIVTANVAGIPFTYFAEYGAAGGGTSGITEVVTQANVSIKTTLDTLVESWADFYAVVKTDRIDLQSQRLAEWTLANLRFCAYQSSTADIPAGTEPNTFNTLKLAGNGRVLQIYDTDDAASVDIAEVANGLSSNPDVSAGVWYDRTLQGETPITITPTEWATIEGYNGCAYLTLFGVGAFGNGRMADGGWADDLIMEDWTNARIQEQLADLRLSTANSNKRIPYTNQGIRQVEARVHAHYLRGVGTGVFKADTYTTNLPDADTLDSITLESRALTFSSNWLKTGGIKDITVNVGITAT